MSLSDRIIETLQNRSDLMQSLINILIFQKTKHSIHDKDRPCYEGNMYDQCDDCYSGDTEFENEEDMRVFFEELASEIQLDESETEGEESE